MLKHQTTYMIRYVRVINWAAVGSIQNLFILHVSEFHAIPVESIEITKGRSYVTSILKSSFIFALQLNSLEQFNFIIVVANGVSWFIHSMLANQYKENIYFIIKYMTNTIIIAEKSETVNHKTSTKIAVRKCIFLCFCNVTEHYLTDGVFVLHIFANTLMQIMQSFLISGIMVNARKGEIFWWRCHNYFFFIILMTLSKLIRLYQRLEIHQDINMQCHLSLQSFFSPWQQCLNVTYILSISVSLPLALKLRDFFFQIFSNKFSPIYFTNQSKVKQTVLFISVHPNDYTVCLYI